MIVIGQPCIVHDKSTDRVVSDIVVNGQTTSVWFEVPKEYGQYLAYERSDAFLIGMLSIAIRKHHDIQCEAPVTEELLYQLQTILIPSLVKNGNNLHPVKIVAKTAPALDNAGGVGTGLSCGVDSMHVVSQFYKSRYTGMNLTHFTFFNVGSFNGIYREAGIDKVRDECRKRAQKCADEMGIPLIVTNSNFQQAYWQDHLFTHTFSSAFAIYMLQKLWKVYYYGSSGYDYSMFTLKNNECISADHYDLLSLSCFSTSKLRIYSEGGEETRFEKQKDIADDKFAQKYLHVCTKTYYNCNTCNKCMRTLLSFDAMGKLDEFANVFDLDYYKSHRKDYLLYLQKCHEGIIDDPMLESSYEILKDDPEMSEIVQNRKSTSASPAIDYKQEYERIKKQYSVIETERNNIVKSHTYRTGKAVLYIPRKVFGLIKKRKKTKNM